MGQNTKAQILKLLKKIYACPAFLPPSCTEITKLLLK